jgi:DDE superfamily endonuclease/Helix-turn-helix of DDE superfamily endonuclease
MLTHDALARHPRAFRSLTGFDPPGFDALFDDYQAEADRRRRRSRTTKKGTRRQRAVGAGPKPTLDARTRLLMALVWLRAYPTYALLGVLFALDAGNAHRNVAGVLAVLDTLTHFPFDRPDRDPERRKVSSLAEVMDAFPDVRLVIDTKEQRCRRPGGAYATQKPYYSGKKRAHTLKTQVGVRPDGRVESVGESIPGGSRHDTTILRESGLLDALADGDGAMMDKAYASTRAEHPNRPIITPEPARRNHPLDEHQKMANRFIARYRIVVEHTLAQMNSYTVLRQVWRGRRDSHHRVVRVVGGLVNRRIDAVPLKRYAA